MSNYQGKVNSREFETEALPREHKVEVFRLSSSTGERDEKWSGQGAVGLRWRRKARNHVGGDMSCSVVGTTLVPTGYTVPQFWRLRWAGQPQFVPSRLLMASLVNHITFQAASSCIVRRRATHGR